MSDARTVIAAALFNYHQGADEARRGKHPWGIEGAEWRADAVIEALTTAGFCIAHPATTMKPREDGEGIA